MARAPARLASQPVFYYELGSPECYLAAERIMGALPVAPEWEPVVGEAFGAPCPQPDRGAIELRAAELELQPLRWPAQWPPETHTAMLAAAYAKQVGRAVAFSLAAFRQGFAGGRDIGDINTVLLAGAACEIHPTALLKGIALRSVQTALADATARARAAGVGTLPAVQVGEKVFEHQRGIDEAAGELAASGV